MSEVGKHEHKRYTKSIIIQLGNTKHLLFCPILKYIDGLVQINAYRGIKEYKYIMR